MSLLETRVHRFGRWSVWQIVEWEGEAFLHTALFPDIPLDRLRAAAPSGVASRVTDAGMIVMANQFFLLKRDDGAAVVVEFGTGNDKTRPNEPYWDHQSLPYAATLESLGVKPAEVAHAFFTHGHLDHVGSASTLVDGKWVPSYPNALHVMDRREWDHWSGIAEGEPDWLASTDDSIRPVVDAGLVHWASDGDVVAGVRVHCAPGHTPGTIVLELEDEPVWFVGDLLHHPAQVSRPEWSAAGFDFDPAGALEQRRRFFERLARSGAVVFAMHTGNPFRVASGPDGFRFEPA